MESESSEEVFWVSARATHSVQVGLGGELDYESRLRIVGRKIMTEGAITGEIGIAPLAYVRYFEDGGDERLAQQRAIVFGRTYLEGRNEAKEKQPSVTWTYLPKPKHYERHYDRRMFDFGISVKAIVGVDLDFSPFEFADLVLGFFGLDIAGDDLGDEASAPDDKTSSGENGLEAEAR